MQANLEIRVGTNGISQAEKGLDNIAVKGAKAEKATDSLGTSTQRATSMLGNMGPRAAQVSYQLQDIAVQAQMGTSAFTILSQQGSQLAASFGPAGAVFGAVIALSSALGGVLYSALSDVSDGIEDLDEKIDSVIGKSLRLKIREVNGYIEEQEQVVNKLKGHISEIDNLPAARSNNIYGSDEERRADREKIEATRAKNRAQQALALADAEERLLSLQKKRLSYSRELDGSAERDKRHDRATSRLAREIEQVRRDGLSIIELEKENHQQRMQVIEEYEKADLGNDVEYFNLKQNEIKRHQDRLLEIERSGLEASRKLKLEDQRATDQLTKQVEQYRLTALDPIAREKENNARRLAAIQQYKDQELGNEVEYNYLLELEAERHARAMLQITEKQEEQKTSLLSASQSATLTATGQLMGNLAAITAEGGKDSFDEYKMFASAQAAISAALAIANAMAAAPPPLNIALASSIGALTAVQIAKINSMEYQGRAKGGQVLGGETYLVGEHGPELLTMGNGNGHVTPNHQLGKNPAQNIQVTNVYQISTGVAGTVRAEIARLTPSIAKLTKQSVENAIREGGSMSRAMGMR